jgi:hypothetical protein
MIPPEIIVQHIREATAKAKPRNTYRRPDPAVNISAIITAFFCGVMAAVVAAMLLGII